MSDIGHTPGPWVQDEAGVCSLSGRMVAILALPDEYFGIDPEGLPQAIHDELAANARLIAAAPDLLEACVAMVEAEDALLAKMRAVGKRPDLTENVWTLVDAMRVAIAKARPEHE